MNNIRYRAEEIVLSELVYDFNNVPILPMLCCSRGIGFLFLLFLLVVLAIVLLAAGIRAIYGVDMLCDQGLAALTAETQQCNLPNLD